MFSIFREIPMVVLRFILPIMLVVSLFLPILPCSSSAHEIYLKNGQIIKTERIERGDGHLTCYSFGGTVTIGYDRVEKIVFSSREAGTDQMAAPAPSDMTGSGGEDLAHDLERVLAPQTAIERANLAVVSLSTVSGSGAGFFISDNGLLVTNRHVVRGSEAKNRKMEKTIRENRIKLNEWKTRLDYEKKRIDRFRISLKADRDGLKKTVESREKSIDSNRLKEFEQSLAERETYVRDWQADYQKRLQQYKRNRRELNRHNEAFQRKNKALAQQSRFTIILADGSEKSAVLYRVSEDLDLALLKLNGYRTPYLTPASRADLTLGQQVYAIGSPLQLKNSVTAGVISHFRGDYIQTNAEIYPGNSGGPLVTEKGLVIGVNTMKMITEKFEGLGFAICIHQVGKEFPEYFSN
ncbi:MAG: hypothetical protein CR981_01665 [Proteobacteria bacterium]|nr:MAG: hypothetical protein CR981_01665 [Pseudomonadota bacterium]